MADQWYALHVRTRFEKYVATHLEQKGYETFAPTYISKRRWSDRIKALSLPLFPSYVFCRFDVDARLPVLMTPGVNFVVGVGRSPVAVDQQEITAIRQVIGSGVATRPWPYLKVGETVRIESGPLEGLVGIVIRTKGSDVLIISVSLLMRSVSVEIGRTQVKPIVPSLVPHSPISVSVSSLMRTTGSARRPPS
jgi:transcription antitermination factor NusG